jgi:hypothetical protein
MQGNHPPKPNPRASSLLLALHTRASSAQPALEPVPAMTEEQVRAAMFLPGSLYAVVSSSVLTAIYSGVSNAASSA